MNLAVQILMITTIKRHIAISTEVGLVLFLIIVLMTCPHLNDPPHKFWICISKTDAKIKSAHCNCVAGMSQSCNHVTALRFRVEAAVRPIHHVPQNLVNGFLIAKL